MNSENQQESLSSFPEDVRKSIINKFDQWKTMKVNSKDETEVKKKIADIFIYDIRMYWQARLNKLDPEFVDALEYLCNKFLPKSLEFNGIKSNQILFPDENHYALAKGVFDKTWDLYVTTPDMKLPFKKTSFFKNIFKKSSN